MAVETLADDPLGPIVNATTFNHEVYLANAITFATTMDDEGWSGDRPLTRWTQLSDGTPERVFTSVGRRTMTRHDPMLFALVYCRTLKIGRASCRERGCQYG